MNTHELQTLIPGHRVVAAGALYYIETDDGARVTEPETWAETVSSAIGINTREIIAAKRRRHALLRMVMAGHNGEES